MNRKIIMKRQFLSGLAALSLGLAANTAGAVDYYLCAGTTSVTMPDSSVVPMWGFAQDDDNDLSNGCGDPVTVPGPAITVPSTHTSLNIFLRNELTQEPVSIVIPGQALPKDGLGAQHTATVFTPTGDTRSRIQSFVGEATFGDPDPQEYHWDNIRPGTYLYHSGTHPQVQVQMGLYGAVTKNASDAPSLEPYSGIGVAGEVTLLYSEIDPALHAAVNNVTAGVPSEPTYTTCTTGFSDCQTAADAGDVPSTVNYKPKWFLVNGEPFTDKLQASSWVGTIPGLGGSYKVLLRLLNAGIKTHSPLIQNARWRVIAENGRPYSYPRDQYTAPVPALTTKDVVLTIAGFDTPKSYAVYDRRLKLTNNGSATGPGGMISFLMVDDDNDADGVPNFGDNCVEVANGPLAIQGVILPDTPADFPLLIQRDSDGDGFGNLCDGDLNNDYQNPLNAVVNFPDLGTFSTAFFTADADADFNGSGLVDFLDLGLFNTMFFNPPGPSCVIPDADPILCPML